MANQIKTFVNQKCRTCLISGSDMHHLQDQYNTNDNSIRNLSELIQSLTSIQISLNDDFPQFICKLCLKQANECYQFRLKCENAQMQLMEDKCKMNVLQMDSTILENNFSCDQCGKDFKYHSSMIKHKQKHNGISHSCPYCSEPLPNSGQLSRHMQEFHSNMKTIKCHQCDKTFFKQANLRIHMIVHSGIKRHMCEVCGVSFALAGNLSAHRRLHTGLKPYICNHCGRGFTQQAALRSHEAGHSNRKDHVCSDCGAAFSRAGALRNHIKRHLSVRPFTCSLCSKAFTFSSERKRHMIIHTGEKNHVCDICGSQFNRSTNLAVHRRIHTGDMPHTCNICGKRFNQAHCLRTHLISHTSNNLTNKT